MKFITVKDLVYSLIDIERNYGNIPIFVGDKDSKNPYVPALTITPATMELKNEKQDFVLITNEVFDNHD